LPTQSQIKKKEKNIFAATIFGADTVSFNKRLRKSFSELVICNPRRSVGFVLIFQCSCREVMLNQRDDINQ
jgi:hypothetical protein